MRESPVRGQVCRKLCTYISYTNVNGEGSKSCDSVLFRYFVVLLYKELYVAGSCGVVPAIPITESGVNATNPT